MKSVKLIEGDPDSLKGRIQRQFEVVHKEVQKFRQTFQGKIIETDRISNYLSMAKYQSSLQSTYYLNCSDYMSSYQRNQVFKMNCDLLDDMASKMQHLMQSLSRYERGQNTQRPITEICHVCDSKIRQIDIKAQKEMLTDDASMRRHLLKKIYADMETDDSDLFSKQEDEVFFAFLKRILIKKEEVLSMQTKEINDFLMDVAKSFDSLSYLTEYVPGNTQLSEGKSLECKENVENSLKKSLQAQFEGKVSEWIARVFQKVQNAIAKEKANKYKDYNSQTIEERYVNKEVKKSQYINSSQHKKETQALKQQIREANQQIDIQKTQLMVVNKEKEEAEKFWKGEVDGLFKKIQSLESEIKSLQKENESNSGKIQMLRQKSKKTDGNQEDDTGTKKSIQFRNEQGVSESVIDLHSNMNLTQRKKKKKVIKNTYLSKTSKGKQSAIEIQEDLTSKQKLTSKVDIDSVTDKQVKKDQKSAEDFLSKMNTSKKKSSKHKAKTALIADGSKKSLKVLDSKKQMQSKKELGRKNVEFEEKTLESNVKRDMKSEISLSSVQETSNQTEFPKQSTRKKINRMISIEHKISPIGQSSVKPHNTEKESIYKHKAKASSGGRSTVGGSKKVINVISKKNLFEILPPQDLQKFEEMKGKVSDISARLEEKNSENLKKILRSSEDKGQELSQIISSIGFASLTKKGQVDQSYLKKDKHSESSLPLKTVDLFQRLKSEKVIAQDLSFSHFEMIVRMFFKQKSKQSSNKNQQPSSNTESPSSLQRKAFSKQKESFKINIDAGILDRPSHTIMNCQSQRLTNKLSMNLPKLNHGRISSRMTSTLNNDLSARNQEGKENRKLSYVKQQTEQNYQGDSSKFLETLKQRIKRRTPTVESQGKNVKQIFGTKDLALFGDEMHAFQYEKTCKNDIHQNGQMGKLSKQQQKEIQSYFKVLSMIKGKNQEVYHKICGFIRYPYQTVKNGFEFINIAKDMSEQSFKHCFSKIYALHQNCGKFQNRNQSLSPKKSSDSHNSPEKVSKSIQKCDHVPRFGNKIMQLLVESSMKSDETEDLSK